MAGFAIGFGYGFGLGWGLGHGLPVHLTLLSCRNKCLLLPHIQAVDAYGKLEPAFKKSCELVEVSTSRLK